MVTRATGSATERFAKLVEVRMAETGEPRHMAHQYVCRAFPELRKQMVSEANAARTPRR